MIYHRYYIELGFMVLKGYKKILNRDNSDWGWEAPKDQKDLKMK